MPRKANQHKFLHEEKTLFISIMKKHLPLGPLEWEIVEDEYNDAQEKLEGGRPIDGNSLKKLWEELAYGKKPTGSSALSQLMSEARSVNKLLNKKACVVEIGVPESDDDSESGDSSSVPACTANRFRTINEIAAEYESTAPPASGVAPLLRSFSSSSASLGASYLPRTTSVPNRSRRDPDLMAMNNVLERMVNAFESRATRSGNVEINNGDDNDRLKQLEQRINSVNMKLEERINSVNMKLEESINSIDGQVRNMKSTLELILSKVTETTGEGGTESRRSKRHKRNNE